MEQQQEEREVEVGCGGCRRDAEAGNNGMLVVAGRRAVSQTTAHGSHSAVDTLEQAALVLVRCISGCEPRLRATKVEGHQRRLVSTTSMLSPQAGAGGH